MNALVIGYGSIGRRHSRLLTEAGHTVSVVTSGEIAGFAAFRTVAEATESANPEYAVVANRTHEHAAVLRELGACGFAGNVLVEKPIVDIWHSGSGSNAGRLEATEHPVYAFQGFKGIIRVGYNLRFHPVMRLLKRMLSREKVLSVQVYAGQLLSEWRSGDYRDSYSSRRKEGGGVLRDLSHELDYLQWLFGPWERVAALGGKLSFLETDSDDVSALLVQLRRCPVATVQLNYLDRPKRRGLIVNTDNHTFAADLIRHTLEIDGVLREYPIDSDYTYRSLHRAMLSGNGSGACTVAEAMETVAFVMQAEKALREESWVKHE